MPEWTLGLGGSDHDASAALMKDGDIRVAIEQERLSRRKHGLAHWCESPVQQAIQYCLAAEGISITDVRRVVASDTLPARVRHDLRGLPLREFPHHLCHAASAYMMLPLGAKAGVIVYDGYGSVRGPAPDDPLRNLRETFSFFLFTPGGFECIGATLGHAYIEKDEFPIGVTNSIGMLYELVTVLLGYDLMDSGKTMGLSSHGVPRYLDALEKFVSFGNEPSGCFRCATDDPGLTLAIEEILRARRGSFAVKADLAASLQHIQNEVLLRCAGFFRGLDVEYLCVSGGSALNILANSCLIERSTRKIPVVIPPHCGDSGLGLGAFWLDQFEQLGAAPELTLRNGPLNPGVSRPGRTYTGDERREAVQQFYPRLALDAAGGSARGLAHALAAGEIVGVLNGASEMGPRALGGRSIFASPNSAMIRERINRFIKEREPFRPLAAMVLDADFAVYFEDCRCADPFMLKVARARQRCLVQAPGVVHVDGTSRVQVVAAGGDPFLMELLQAFREETGIGVLINTSFNRRGEPLVESPADAIEAFLGMGLDGLYLDGEFYRPIPLPRRNN
jgi:carbamoyltransferase